MKRSWRLFKRSYNTVFVCNVQFILFQPARRLCRDVKQKIFILGFWFIQTTNYPLRNSHQMNVKRVRIKLWEFLWTFRLCAKVWWICWHVRYLLGVLPVGNWNSSSNWLWGVSNIRNDDNLLSVWLQFSYFLSLLRSLYLDLFIYLFMFWSLLSYFTYTEADSLLGKIMCCTLINLIIK